MDAHRTARPLTAWLSWALLGALTVLFVFPAFAHAFEVWSTTEEFSFGYAIPLVTLGLLWWRREDLRRRAGKGSAAGLVIALGAMALYLLGQRAGVNAVAGLAVIPLLWGAAVYLWGWGVGRVALFPLAFLAFGLGLYRGLLSSVGFVLQEITARGSGLLATLVGLDVARDGLVLYSEQFAFIVAEACSGMSSLLSLLALAALWTHLARGAPWTRLVVLASVAPLVVLANVLRVTAVLGVASVLGQDAALGFFHGASSLVLFGVALGGLLLVSWRAGCRLPQFAA